MDGVGRGRGRVWVLVRRTTDDERRRTTDDERRRTTTTDGLNDGSYWHHIGIILG